MDMMIEALRDSEIDIVDILLDMEYILIGKIFADIRNEILEVRQVLCDAAVDNIQKHLCGAGHQVRDLFA
jgi:hypothetical protein